MYSLIKGYKTAVTNYLALLVLIILNSLPAYSQIKDSGDYMVIDLGYSSTVIKKTKIDSGCVTKNIDQSPEFPGGNENLYLFFRENLVMPEIYRVKDQHGIAWVEFSVDSNGKVTPIPGSIMLPLQPYQNALIAVLNKMPRWKPAQYKGKPVYSRMQLPIAY